MAIFFKYPVHLSISNTDIHDKNTIATTKITVSDHMNAGKNNSNAHMADIVLISIIY